MTVALYCRVSTDEQATQGFSLDAQQQRLKAFCVSQGWNDFTCFVDDESATEPFDTSTPLGRAMLGILAVFAQLERDTMIERTKGGLRQRVSRGLWSGAKYPFGYTMNKETGILDVVPEEAALVREVYRKFLAGENRASIQRWLQKRTAARNINTLFTRRLLTRETYTGKIVLKGEVFEGQHEAIIDQKTFDRVQAKLANIIVPRGGERHLLTSLVQCGVCGDNMSYWESHQKRPHVTRKYMRLICNTKRIKSTNCTSKSILAREVEAEVVQIILTSSLDIPVVATQNEAHEEDVIRELEKQVSHIDEQSKSLLDAVQHGLPFTAVKERFNHLEKNRSTVQAQLDDIMTVQPNSDAEEIVNVLTQEQEVWQRLDAQEQRAILKFLIRKARVFPDKHVEIEWNL